MPTERFKDKEAYRRWNAYRHIHGIKAPHLRDVVVGGKRHKFKHTAATRRHKRKPYRKHHRAR